MYYKAKVTFAGKISMMCNEVREINDKELINDLLNAGYIEQVQEQPAKKMKKRKNEHH